MQLWNKIFNIINKLIQFINVKKNEDEEDSEDESESENEDEDEDENEEEEEEEEEENKIEKEVNEKQSIKYTKTLYSDYINPKPYNQSKQESKSKSYNFNQLKQEPIKSKSYNQPKQESLRSRKSYNQLKQEPLESKSYNQPKQSPQDTQEQPVRRQRPVTSDVVARRLISSALGIKPREKTAEEKEIDRKKFEEARAQRLAARLERQKRLQENSDIFNE